MVHSIHERVAFGKYMMPRTLVILAIFGFIASKTIHSESSEAQGAMKSPSNSSDVSVARSTQYCRDWPDGRPALFRLPDHTVLAIPPQYMKFWLQKDRVTQKDKMTRAPANSKDIPLVKSVGFQFFMPNFSGYTPKNYLTEFDEDLVDVISIEPGDPAQMVVDAPGSYPPNVIKRLLATLLSPDKYVDQFGLRCYVDRGDPRPKRLTCYGRRDDKTGEYILLKTYIPPFEVGTYPTMQASYFSNHYGGMTLLWRAHAKYLSRWRDIDSQIWQFIAAWTTSEDQLNSMKQETCGEKNGSK
jgi:hypothetical protein